MVTLSHNLFCMCLIRSCRVAIDRGLRLADKRSFPCPRRNEWIAARDSLYEEVMEKAYNKELGIFGQSYEDTDVLDSSLCIMPLVFFSSPVSLLSFYTDASCNTYTVVTKADPRFLNTLRKILLTPERGGLTSNVCNHI